MLGSAGAGAFRLGRRQGRKRAENPRKTAGFASIKSAGTSPAPVPLDAQQNPRDRFDRSSFD